MFPGKLARLSDKYQRNSQPVGQWRREDKAPGLDPGDRTDFRFFVYFHHPIHAIAESFGIGEDARDVKKDNPFFGIIGNLPDSLIQIIKRVMCISSGKFCYVQTTNTLYTRGPPVNIYTE
jgi:hypothetical protein